MMLMERGLRLGLKRRKKRSRGDYSTQLETNNDDDKKNKSKNGFELIKCSRKRSNNYNHGDCSPLVKKRLKKNHEDNNKKRKKESGRKTTSGFGLRKCSESSPPPFKTGDTTLKIGDRVDLLDLLFTNKRDYLITYKDRNRPVLAKHLEGKFIILHFVPLAPWSSFLWLYISSLVDIYNALHPKGGFEVVFIGLELEYGKYASRPTKLSKSFEKMLSIMPWPAIPDIKSLRYWERKLRFPLSKEIGEFATCSLVIDPTGVLLNWGVDMCFAKYGAEGFPFTDDRIDFLVSQDEEALKHPSITALLTSPERDYVINNKGQAVPVHTLEDKVVALYFYLEEESNDTLIEEFKTVYQQLANAQNFEIVFVYVHDSLRTCRYASEELFWAHFNDMPWLALPFKDPKCKNLQRIFRIPMDLDGRGPDPTLVIVGPGGKYFEPYGGDILIKFGISAYPFTRTRVVEVDAEFVRNLKLDRIMDPNTYFTQENGPNVKLSQLLGERIILVVEGYMSTATPEFWQDLRARYLQVKETDAKFQVIHIHWKWGPSCPKHVGATTLWLRHPPFHEESHIYKLFFRLFRYRVGLLAFDCDGRVVRKTIFPSIEEGNMDFPFHAGGLEEVVLADLVKQYEWDFGWD